VADALEAWLLNHGYKFEPGSGESAAKAALLTAGGPVARRTGGGSFGGSRGSFSGSGQGLTGSRSGSVRPKSPSRDDTVYDKTRVDTRKGDSNVKPGGGKRSPTAKPLPVAKPLDSLPGDKKSSSGGNPVVTGSSVSKSGPQPVTKVASKVASGAVAVIKSDKSDPGTSISGPQRATPLAEAPKPRAPAPAPMKVPFTVAPWMIAVAAGTLLLIVLVMLVMMM